MKELLQSQLLDLQREKNYMIIKNHIKFSYKKDLEQFIYYYNVWKYTTINSPNVKDIEKRGKDFHLDHIIPIKIGYKYNISPQIIGSLPNLRIIDFKSNLHKSNRITDDTIKVLSLYNIDLSTLPIISKEIFSEKIIKRPNNKICLDTNNTKSLLYYRYANKLRPR